MSGMFLGVLVFRAIAFHSLNPLYKYIIVQVADEFVSRREETEWLVDADFYCYFCSSGFKIKLLHKWNY
jgi:hypothetical protein